MKLFEALQEKDFAKRILLQVIVTYLKNLQSGKYGEPAIEDLQNAGILHEFLEKDSGIKNESLG